MSRNASGARSTLPVLLALIAGGCGITDPPERANITFWEASLAPLGAETVVTGQAAAIARHRVTEVGIGINAVPTGMVLRWGFFEGSCSDPGELLGAEINYPTLSGETTTGEGVIGVRLQTGETYNVAILDDEDGERLACGDLALEAG